MNATTTQTTTPMAGGPGIRHTSKSVPGARDAKGRWAATGPGGNSCSGPQRRRQVRLRLGKATAEQLRQLPHAVRAEVVTLAVNAALAGVAVPELVGYRQELRNLGTLINQSLKFSRGVLTNPVAVEKVVQLINQLVKQ